MKQSKSKFQLFVGIDIAKGKADAAILKVFPDQSRKDQFPRKKVRFSFHRSSVDDFHQTVLKYSDENCTGIVYAMEDTGSYYQGFYSYMKEIIGSQESLKILKPSYVSHWCSLHEKSKSDPLDAQAIAQIMAYERDVKTVEPGFTHEKRDHRDLRTVTRRYAQLKKISSQESTRLIGIVDSSFPEISNILGNGMTFLQILAVYPSPYDIIHADKQKLADLIIKASKGKFQASKADELKTMCQDSLMQDEPSEYWRENVKSLIRHLLDLRQELESLKKEMKNLCEQIPGYQQLRTIPGCGLITAAVMLAEIMDISRFKSADALISYAGTDPVNKRSGSSIHTEGQISRKGSRYLRYALILFAEIARRHNPVLKELFERLKTGQRKRHYLALVAVANKLLRYVYSVLKNQCEFVINFKDLMKLQEGTRTTFFQNITTNISEEERRMIYQYEDENGEIHPFVYTVKYTAAAAQI